MPLAPPSRRRKVLPFWLCRASWCRPRPGSGSPTHLHAAPTGIPSARTRCCWVTKPALATVAATARGHAACATPRLYGPPQRTRRADLDGRVGKPVREARHHFVARRMPGEQPIPQLICRQSAENTRVYSPPLAKCGMCSQPRVTRVSPVACSAKCLPEHHRVCPPIKPLPGTAVRVRATLSIDPLAGIERSLRCETSRPVQLGRQRCALSRGPAMARCTGRRSTSSARRLTGQPWFVSPRHLDPHGWRADCSRSRTAGVPQNCAFAVN
jgi:hypothetical protein